MLERECAKDPGVPMRTSHPFPGRDTSSQAIEPTCVCLCFFKCNGVTLLEDLVYCYQGLECLYLIGKDRLAVLCEDDLLA